MTQTTRRASPMSKTAYISKDNTVVIRCDQCQRIKTLDLAPYGGVQQPMKVKIKCACGHLFTSIVEKRRVYRKQVSLKGSFVHFVGGQPKGKGAMTVVDISNSGMKLMLPPGESMAVGDMLKVEFRLDDPRRSLIKKRLIVRNVKANLVGAEFGPSETIDTSLGFYLLS